VAAIADATERGEGASAGGAAAAGAGAGAGDSKGFVVRQTRHEVGPEAPLYFT